MAGQQAMAQKTEILHPRLGQENRNNSPPKLSWLSARSPIPAIWGPHR